MNTRKRKYATRDSSSKVSVKEQAHTSKETDLPQLRVLSLFDGIGTGYYALQSLGFDVETFCASEIDDNALLLTKSHYNDSIHQLGSVTEINLKTLEEIGPINFLMGGSPCSDLSCVNHRKKGLYNVEGSGILFFDFYKIWNILRNKNKKENRTFYWMFENVANMEIKTKKSISKFLECEPYILDSIHLSPQRRKRFFWTNIPGVENLTNIITKIEKPATLQECLDGNLNRMANVSKITTITTKRNCLQDGKSKNPVNQNGKFSGLYITELEKIFGFDPHYTDVANFTITDRQKLLGKAWSVQVVKEIFKLLTEIFKMKK